MPKRCPSKRKSTSPKRRSPKKKSPKRRSPLCKRSYSPKKRRSSRSRSRSRSRRRGLCRHYSPPKRRRSHRLLQSLAAIAGVGGPQLDVFGSPLPLPSPITAALAEQISVPSALETYASAQHPVSATEYNVAF